MWTGGFVYLQMEDQRKERVRVTRTKAAEHRARVAGWGLAGCLQVTWSELSDQADPRGPHPCKPLFLSQTQAA